MDTSQLIDLFRRAELPQEQWTHRAHLRVALATLRDMPPEKALARLRTEIQNLNLAHGVYTTPLGGYHETRTRVWLAVLSDALDSSGEIDAELVERFSTRDVCMDYYSLSRLNSWEARLAWVDPDLRALPVDPGPWCLASPELFTFLPEDEQ